MRGPPADKETRGEKKCQRFSLFSKKTFLGLRGEKKGSGRKGEEFDAHDFPFLCFPVLSKPTREEKVSGRQELSGEKNAETVFFTREGIREVFHNL